MFPFSWFGKEKTSRLSRSGELTRVRPQLEPLEHRVVPATIVVTDVNDDAFVDGLVSLREALLSVNGGGNFNVDVVATGDPYGTNDRIEFEIPGSGPHTIQVLSPLPNIFNAVHIDGASEPDFAGTPVIELDGTNAGVGTDGLRIQSSGSIIQALAINRFDSNGVEIASGSGNLLLGNFIGTDTSGDDDFGNGDAGVRIEASAMANTIGGTTAAARNLLSGNEGAGVTIEGSSNNVVLGNYIGTDRTGTEALPNTFSGVILQFEADENILGGTTASARNLISGNTEAGISVFDSDDNQIQGNYIGTDVTGMERLGNGFDGIFLSNAFRTTVGGLTSGARNLISDNGGDGVDLTLDSGDNLVVGNYIGTDASGTADLGNEHHGVNLRDGATANTVGGTTPAAANTIAFNGRDGVAVGVNPADDPLGNSVLRNSIFSNVGLGIDLGNNGVTVNDTGDPDAGPNRLQNFPNLTRVKSGPAGTLLEGTLNSTPGRMFRLEFFSNPAGDPSGFGEGRTFLGSLAVTTDGTTGDVTFSTTIAFSVAGGTPITATATDMTTGETSEFSRFAIVDSDAPTVTIDQAVAQLDPTATQPIVFTVIFSEAVTGFNANDISFVGSTLDSLAASVAESGPLDGTTYTVNVLGATGSGTVVASVLPGAIQDAVGNASDASTSTDNSVTFDEIAPLVTIEEVVGASSSYASRTFTVTFDESVLGFTAADVQLGGTAGPTTATVTGSGADYTVTVTGMSRTGSLTVTVPDSSAIDMLGQPNVGTTLTVRFGEFLVTGAGEGGGPRVVVRDAVTGATKFDFFAYNAAFAGGVRVATGDINGDFTPDIITAAGPGGGPHVRVFDGNTGGVIRDFFAYSAGFAGGVFVASGDVNGDSFDDIITGAGAGGTSHVRVLSGRDLSELAGFFAYDPAFAGGVQVAADDVDGDGRADIITGAGPGGSPHVKVVNALFANQRGVSGQIEDAALLANFFAYDPGFTGGVFVATADIDGDGRADIITGAGAGGGPHVKVVNATQADQRQPNGVISDAALLANFFAYEPPFASPTVGPVFTGGVRVASLDFDGDARVDLVTAPGPGAALPVRVRDGQTLAEVDSFFAFDAFAGGTFV